jgi:radical SAM enzyme (TIGR01210 family)
MNTKTVEKLAGGLRGDDLTGALKNARYLRSIAMAQRMIHQQIPKVDYDPTQAASTAFDRKEIFAGVNCKKAVIFLMSNGCEWALQSGHGCTMCGHLAKQARINEPISPLHHIQQFEKEFRKIDFKTYPLLNIFNNGSFLNDNEIHPSARTEILKTINAQPDIKMLVIESRPEYATEEKVKEVKRLVKEKFVEIAIGLELKDDVYRAICFNKGFTLQNYNEAAGIIRKHLHLRTYVFLKPLFLTEKESIEHSIATIRHAFAQGSSTVSLEAGTIQDFTLAQYLHSEKLYTTPWLWSILEVVKQCGSFNRLIIGMFQFYPSPTSVPYNCDRCSQEVMNAISQYNHNLDTSIFNGLDCQCREKWQKILNEPALPFETRLKMAVTHFKNKLGV